jgi:hypothetical protein
VDVAGAEVSAPAFIASELGVRIDDVWYSENLTFGLALEVAKQGARLRRRGWNGPGQWVCLMPPTTIPAEMVNTRTRKFLPTGDLVVGGYFVIFTTAGVWQPGWVPSQADLLARDWELVPTVTP